MHDVAERWLASSAPGFCGVTGDADVSSCNAHTQATSGAFGLSQHASQNLSRAVSVCLRRCARCEKCHYITVSPDYRDCSWYTSCDLSALRRNRHPMSGYTSGRAIKGLETSKPVQHVVLFVHMEKTAGTLVRSLFRPPAWNRSAYCKASHVMVADLRKRLSSGETRIFMEHHCSIDWNLPSTFARVALSHRRANSARVRFRSFTTLRSPLTLAFSQYHAWHTELRVSAPSLTHTARNCYSYVEAETAACAIIIKHMRVVRYRGDSSSSSRRRCFCSATRSACCASATSARPSSCHSVP